MILLVQFRVAGGGFSQDDEKPLDGEPDNLVRQKVVPGPRQNLVGAISRLASRMSQRKAWSAWSGCIDLDAGLENALLHEGVLQAISGNEVDRAAEEGGELVLHVQALENSDLCLREVLDQQVDVAVRPEASEDGPKGPQPPDLPATTHFVERLEGNAVEIVHRIFFLGGNGKP